MGFDATRVNLTDEAQQIAHPDKDLKAGHSVVARCATADIAVGGEDVTAATGYIIPADTEWGWTSEDGAPFVLLAAGAGPIEMQVLWGGV